MKNFMVFNRRRLNQKQKAFAPLRKKKQQKYTN